MKFDNYGCIITEGPSPGCLGDSLANTARHDVLTGVAQALSQFITPLGYVRHPDSPWREDETSADQMLPLQMAREHVKSNKSIGCYLLSRDWLQSFGVITVIQALIFMVPVRWSDDNRPEYAGLVRVIDNDSADYLNYWVSLHYLNSRGVRWPSRVCAAVTRPRSVYRKVCFYFKSEPNSRWILKAYKDSIRSVYKKP